MQIIITTKAVDINRWIPDFPILYYRRFCIGNVIDIYLFSFLDNLLLFQFRDFLARGGFVGPV